MKTMLVSGVLLYSSVASAGIFPFFSKQEPPAPAPTVAQQSALAEESTPVEGQATPWQQRWATFFQSKFRPQAQTSAEPSEVSGEQEGVTSVSDAPSGADAASSAEEASSAPASAWRQRWDSVRASMDLSWVRQAIEEGKVPPHVVMAAGHVACVGGATASVVSLGWGSLITVPYRAMTLELPATAEESRAVRVLRSSMGGVFGPETLKCLEDLYNEVKRVVAKQPTVDASVDAGVDASADASVDGADNNAAGDATADATADASVDGAVNTSVDASATAEASVDGAVNATADAAN